MKEQKDEDLARARDEKIASEAYDEVAEMEQENGELLQDLQRTRAEFENYRKRSEQNLALAKSAGKAGSPCMAMPWACPARAGSDRRRAALAVPRQKTRRVMTPDMNQALRSDANLSETLTRPSSPNR